MEITNVTIGSDVEFFLKNIKENEIISAENLIKGTKDNPYEFDPENSFYKTSLDNVLAEGNIPPAKDAFTFYKNIEKLRNYIDSNLPENIITLASASERLDPIFLNTPQALTYGCMPSINAWTGEEIRPILDQSSNIRGAGFHIHIGYDQPNDYTNFRIIKALDLFLGLPALLIEPLSERKEAGYGWAGNCRMCDYGVEYRSLSSYFASNQTLIDFVFNNTLAAIDFINSGKYDSINIEDLHLEFIINYNLLDDAERILNNFKIKQLSFINA